MSARAGICEDCGKWTSVLVRIKAGWFCEECRPKHRER